MTFMYQDTDFNPDREQEERQAVEREELARNIRREVLRIRRGEADDDIRADEERDAAEREEREAAEAKRRRRHASAWWQLLSGTILVRDGATEYYRYLALIAGMFFVSIVMLFTALRLDIRYARLDSEVQLLHERSIRMQEECYKHSSHSAVVERLRERGIKLYDPLKPSDVIE